MTSIKDFFGNKIMKGDTVIFAGLSKIREPYEEYDPNIPSLRIGLIDDILVSKNDDQNKVVINTIDSTEKVFMTSGHNVIVSNDNQKITHKLLTDDL